MNSTIEFIQNNISAFDLIATLIIIYSMALCAAKGFSEKSHLKINSRTHTTLAQHTQIWCEQIIFWLIITAHRPDI